MKVSRLVRRGLDGLYLGAGWLAGLFLIAILLLMLGLSLGRMINVNVRSGDDFTAWCMAATAFLGLAYTFKAGDMIRVGLVIDKIGGKARRVIEIVCLLIGTGFIGFFSFHACFMVRDSWRFMDMSQGVVAVPLWIPQIGYAAGLCILLVAFVDELVCVLAGSRPSYVPPPPTSAAEVVERAIQSGV